MTNPFGRKARLMFGVVLCLLAAPTLADPPARVGRVAVAEGRVEFLPEAGGAAVASPLNYPVLAESRLRTGDDGHAEVQLGDTTVWLAPGTALGFTGLDEDVLELELTEGDLALRVHESPGYGPLQLRTLPADVSIGAEGRYRITTDTVSTQVIVHEGLARVTAGDEIAYVSAGRTLVASRGGIVSQAASGRGVGPDGDPFERWVTLRDRWYWSPGHIVERPVFAPAVVVFIGTTSVDRHFHRSRPPKKWAPLGPRERFVPPFRASSRFSERLNAPHLGAPRHFPGLPDARRVRDRDGDGDRDVRRFERDDDRRQTKRSEPDRGRRGFGDRRSDTPPSGTLGHPSRRFPTEDLVAPRAAPVPRSLEERTRADEAAARRRLRPTTEPVPHLQRTSGGFAGDRERRMRRNDG